MRMLSAFLVLLIPLAAPAETVLFEETFENGKLSEGWTWKRENPKGWRIKGKALKIRIEPGNMWGKSNDARNVLLRPLPDSGGAALAISCTVENDPTNQYEQVDLVWYFDDSNMVKIGLEQVDGQRTVVMGREEADRTRTIKIIPMPATTVQLRLTGVDGKVRGEYRIAGIGEWHTAGQCKLPPGDVPHLSIQAYQGDRQQPHWAQVSDIKIARD